MSNEQTIKHLRAAREYLFEHGWHQGHMYGPDDTVCALGAIQEVVKGTFGYAGDQPAGRAFRTTVHMNVPDWNDNPGRTFDEVIDAFDLTIKRLEQP